MENLPDTPINDQWDDSIEATPELNQPIENNIPSTVEQPLNERENTIRDPAVVVARSFFYYSLQFGGGFFVSFVV